MPPSPDLEWVGGLPLPDASSLQLAVHPDPAGAGLGSPFVSLSPGGRYAQVLLGRFALSDGTVLRHVALKLPAASWRRPSAAWTLAQIDNSEVAGMWERERQALRDLDHPGLARGMDLTAGAWMPALHYCRSQKCFFTPPSPVSGGRLEICLDEAMLRNVCLESATSGQYLYLHDPSQSVEGPKTFFTWSADGGEGLRSGFLLRRRGELYRDLGGLLERERHGDLDEALRAELRAEFPCVSCSQRDQCYAKTGSEVPAERQLTPLTFLPGPVLCTTAAQFHVDELCDLLGGARREQAVRAAAPGRQFLIDQLPRSPRAAGYHHGGELGPEFFAEVLMLKLGVLQQVAEGLQAFHHELGRPHLGLAPDNLMAEALTTAPGLPSRWAWRLRIQDLGCQHRNAMLGTRDVWVPAVDTPSSFVGEAAEPGQFRQEWAMTCTLESLEQRGEGVVLQVELRTQGARVAFGQPGDHLRFEPHAAIQGLGDAALVGELLKVEPARLEARLELPAGATLDASSLPLRTQGTAVVLRRLDAGSDLVGLGKLLLRALLVHDERDFFAAEDLMQQLRDDLELAVAGVEEPDEAYVSAKASNLLEEARLLPTELLFQAADRAALRQCSLSPTLAQIWVDSLQLILRALYPHAVGDFGLSQQEQPVASFARLLGGLRRRLQVELFGQAGRERSIDRARAQLLAEVNTRLYGEEAGA